MDILQASILIDASPQKVWHTMLDDEGYREWTKAFDPGSFYQGRWETGEEMRFLTTGPDGKLQGLYSRIKESIPYQLVAIEHLGLIKDDVVDTTSEEVQKWAPSYENYSLRQKGEKTEVKIEMTVQAEYREMMEKMWKKALQKLKQLCEKT